MTTARLLFRIHRFESLAVAAGALLLAVAGLYVASRLNGAAVETGCVQQWFDSGPVAASPACEESRQAFNSINEYEAGKVMAGMAVLPFVAGLLLGVPLVAREVEQRTVTLAWSLQSSRVRWLLKRALIAAAMLAAVLTIPAGAAEVLEPTRHPWLDPSTTAFSDYGLRGPLTVFRGLAAFSIGVLVGAAVGRVLPALIVAAVGTVLLFQVLAAAQWAFLPEPELLPVTETQVAGRGGLQTGDGIQYRDRAGATLTWDEIIARSPFPYYDEELEDVDPRFSAWFDSDGYEEYEWFIRGERLGVVAVREAAGLSVLSTVLLGMSLVVVRGRRPY